MITSIPKKGKTIYHNLYGALLTLNKYPIGDWMTNKGYMLFQDKTGIVLWISVKILLTSEQFEAE